MLVIYYIYASLPQTQPGTEVIDKVNFDLINSERPFQNREYQNLACILTYILLCDDYFRMGVMIPFWHVEYR